MNDESYENIFSKDNPNYFNSTFYNIVPTIDINSSTNTLPSQSSLSFLSNESINNELSTNSNHENKGKNNNEKEETGNNINTLSFSFNDDFIDDSVYGNYSFQNNTVNNKNSYSFGKRKNINNDSNYYSSKLLDESLKYINTNINIYNYNINLYKKSVNILEKYFEFLFTSIDQCFNRNIKTLTNMKQNDQQFNITRNYSPLIEYMISIYQLHEMYINDKINEIKEYMLTIEKKLLKHSEILIQGIWFYLHFITLPVNNSSEYYRNYNMEQTFNKIKLKFQSKFNIIYKLLLD